MLVVIYEFILVDQGRYDGDLNKDRDSKNGKKQIYFRDICDVKLLRFVFYYLVF